MKIKARGDFAEWFLLSPEFIKKEAQESDRDLLLHKMSKKEVKEAWVNYRKGFP